MIEELRREFNAGWTEAKFEREMQLLEGQLGERPAFPIAETPVFLPAELLDRMVGTAEELTRRLAGDAAYLRASEAAIPERYRVAEPDGVRPPNFMTADFGFVREGDGSLGIRLVELQAFPSVLGFQDYFAAATVEAFGLGPGLGWLLGGHDRESYWQLLREVLLGGYAPEEVVLLEVDPARQKTRIDFWTYQRRLGIEAVDVRAIRRVGRRLERQKNGQWVPIRRVFNRAIADEMERLGVVPAYAGNVALDTEWAGHPNWYFRASKFSLPFLKHPEVPPAMFLDQYLDDSGELGTDLERLVLKPLYSFAGRGIRFAPTAGELLAIPAGERAGYLLQRREHFVPVIETPFGPTQAEIRVMLVARDGGPMQAVVAMARLGRGLMMGVDHNQGQRWVGGAVVLRKCQK